jgi:hypothetical protein
MAETRVTLLGVFLEKWLVVCGVSFGIYVRAVRVGDFRASEDDGGANFFSIDA